MKWQLVEKMVRFFCHDKNVLVLLDQHYCLFLFFISLPIVKCLVNVVDGEILSITKVSRLHMAAYLCVASNGVPPSISKRVQLRVQCRQKWNCNFIYLDSNFRLLLQFHQCYQFQINLKVLIWVKKLFLNVILKHIQHL